MFKNTAKQGSFQHCTILLLKIGKVNHSLKMKWEPDPEITEEDRFKLCLWQCSSIPALKYGRDLHDFIMPQKKSKQLKIPQSSWRQWGSQEGDHTHIFWSCPRRQPFWNLFIYFIYFFIYLTGTMHIKKHSCQCTKVSLRAIFHLLSLNWW